MLGNNNEQIKIELLCPNLTSSNIFDINYSFIYIIATPVGVVAGLLIAVCAGIAIFIIIRRRR
jgi:hypothetical protein